MENTNRNKLDAREQVIKIIKAFSGSENILAIPRLFVNITGDLSLAAMLNQLLYWSGKVTREDGYIYKSQKDWNEEIGGKGMTRHTVEEFKSLPYIKTKVMKANGVPTTYYKVDFDILIMVASEILTNGNVTRDISEMSPETNGSVTRDISLYTETTTENTTEKEIKRSLSDVQKGSKPKSKNEQYMPAAIRLSEIVIKEKNIKIGANKIKTWAEDIRKLVEVDGVSAERLKKALNWYSVNVGGEYIPVVERGKALREKFLKVEAAMRRGGRGRTKETKHFESERDSHCYDDVKVIEVM